MAQAREIVGPECLVGLSTHSPAQIDAAGAQDVDYIGVGPVHATPTKPGRAAVGLALVKYAAAHARVPFFAIGGIGAISHWVLDTSVFHQMASAPAVPPHWEANGVMVAIGVASALIGGIAFSRRDLRGE